MYLNPVILNQQILQEKTDTDLKAFISSIQPYFWFSYFQNGSSEIVGTEYNLFGQ